MNCVTITGTIEGEPVAAGPVTSVKVAVPRWGPAGREPGVLYVGVRIVGGKALDLRHGDLIGLTGWIEDSNGHFDVECSRNMVTTLSRP